jgi:AcrR family transcriptional regulator
MTIHMRNMLRNLYRADMASLGWEPQRTAASRNREAILRAAAGLFEEHGVDRVDVRQIAAAAGVGMGTIYRRFGDKASVIAALLDDQERGLQDAVLRGPPPLGPGASATERLEAFLRVLAEHTERNLDLLFASEASAPAGRYRLGSYGAWRQHAAILIADADPSADAGWLADLVLAPLAPALYRHHRRDRGLSADQIVANTVAAAQRLIN